VPCSDAVGHLLFLPTQFRVHLRPEHHHLRTKFAFVGLVDVVQSTLSPKQTTRPLWPAFKYLAPSTHLISFRERGQVPCIALGNLPDLHEGDVSFVATLVFSHGTRVTSPQKTIEGRYSAVSMPVAQFSVTLGTSLTLTILSPWPSVFTRLG